MKDKRPGLTTDSLYRPGLSVFEKVIKDGLVVFIHVPSTVTLVAHFLDFIVFV